MPIKALTNKVLTNKVLTKRPVLSLIVSLSFLLLYSLAVRAANAHLDSPAARLAVAAPIAWPLYIYYALPIFPHLGKQAQIFVSVIIDVGSYGLLAYAFLTWSAKRKLKLA